MTKLRRVFELTKSEQRVAIVIVLLLVGIAIAKRHYSLRDSTLPTTSSTPTPTVVKQQP